MRWILPLFTAILGALLGVWLGSTHVTNHVCSPLPVPTPPQAVPFPMEARLGANLYMHTSAEYMALCLQTYQLAESRLTELMQKPKPLPPAVVMDLDETVLDNGAMQSFLHRNNLEYSDELWKHYEINGVADVKFMPGAVEFIAAATKLNVTVIFISNRMDDLKPHTLDALKPLGIPREQLSDRVLLKVGKESDKTLRRQTVEAKYSVLMYFGDSLRDFSENFVAPKLTPNDTVETRSKAIADRKQKVTDARGHWGVDWFVLPNPCYGEWERFHGSNDPKLFLHPTTLVKP